MSARMIDQFKEIVKALPESQGAIRISETDGYKIYQEINDEMKEYKREFSRKEKESNRAASEILLNS
jgi:hypothetical protein